MNEHWNLKLLGLLSDASPATDEDMQRAYEDFTAQITAIGVSESGYADIFRALNHIRIEFDSLRVSLRYGQEKKCPETRIPSKSSGFCQFRAGIAIP